MDKIQSHRSDGDRDLEKGANLPNESPTSPISQATWQSQTETITNGNSGPTMAEQDSDEENMVHQTSGMSRTARFLRPFLPKGWKQPPKQSLRTIYRKIENCEYGYPYLASYLDSDENFMIYRRFGFLHSRLLLRRQDELRVMEEKLDRIDKRDKIKNVRVLKCRQVDVNTKCQDDESREFLLSQIEETILKYDQLLLNAQQLVAANRPPERDYNSVAWFVQHKKPLLQGDDDFIFNKEDLITLRPGRDRAWLDTTVEKLLKIFPRNAVKYAFCSKERADKTTDDQLFLTSKSRVDKLVTSLIMIMVLALLIVPVYALYHVGSSFNKDNANASNVICMGILLIATLLFLAALALFTKAKRHELLGAAAAYCALLVVFIANLGINSVG